MQHPHRTTLWRRKRKRATKRGRNRRGNAREKFNVRLLAKLLRAVYETGRHGPKRAVSMTEAVETPVDRTCRGIERALLQRSEPVGLMVLVLWEYYRPEERRRKNTARGAGVKKSVRNKALEKAAVAAMRREYGWSETKAAEFVASHRGEPWIAALVSGEGSGAPSAKDAPAEAACPSNYFKISRSTLSYYRDKMKPKARARLGGALSLLAVAPPHYLAR